MTTQILEFDGPQDATLTVQLYVEGIAIGTPVVAEQYGDDPTLYRATFSNLDAGLYKFVALDDGDVVARGQREIDGDGVYRDEPCVTDDDLDELASEVREASTECGGCASHVPCAEGLTGIVAEAATRPASTTHDGTAVQRRTLTELIEADKHVRAQTALDDPSGWPLRTFKIRPPGGR